MTSPPPNSTSSLSILERIALQGFGSNEQRKQVWYSLYGIKHHSSSSSALVSTVPKLPLYHPQILLDVHRSFHYDTCIGWTAKTRQRKLEYLSYVLQSVFPIDINSPPYYVQGIHDIASVLLLNTTGGSGGQDPGGCIELLRNLVNVQLLGYVQPDMQVTLALLYLIEQILTSTDPVLLQHIRYPEDLDDTFTGTTNGKEETFPPSPPIFAVPWIITWFSHSTDRLTIITRLFDIFLVHHPLVPIYIVAALLIAYRREILAVHSTDLYMLLQNLPTRIITVVKKRGTETKKKNTQQTQTKNNDGSDDSVSMNGRRSTEQKKTVSVKEDSKPKSVIMFRRLPHQKEIRLHDLVTLARILYHHIPPEALLQNLSRSKPSESSYTHLQTLKERWNDIFYWHHYFSTGTSIFGLSSSSSSTVNYTSSNQRGHRNEQKRDDSSTAETEYRRNIQKSVKKNRMDNISTGKRDHSVPLSSSPPVDPLTKDGSVCGTNETRGEIPSNYVDIKRCLDDINLSVRSNEKGSRKYFGICRTFSLRSYFIGNSNGGGGGGDRDGDRNYSAPISEAFHNLVRVRYAIELPPSVIKERKGKRITKFVPETGMLRKPEERKGNRSSFTGFLLGIIVVVFWGGVFVSRGYRHHYAIKQIFPYLMSFMVDDHEKEL